MTPEQHELPLEAQDMLKKEGWILFNIAYWILSRIIEPNKYNLMIKLHRLFRGVDDLVDESPDLTLEEKYAIVTQLLESINMDCQLSVTPVNQEAISLLKLLSHIKDLLQSTDKQHEILKAISWGLRGFLREIELMKLQSTPRDRIQINDIRVRAWFPYLYIIFIFSDQDLSWKKLNKIKEFIKLLRLLKFSGDLRDLHEDIALGQYKFAEGELSSPLTRWSIRLEQLRMLKEVVHLAHTSYNMGLTPVYHTMIMLGLITKMVLDLVIPLNYDPTQIQLHQNLNVNRQPNST